MNKDDIIRMARKAGMQFQGGFVRVVECVNENELERFAALIAAEKDKEIAKLIGALESVIPFVATQAVGCHGYKCREPWCWSCYGEDDAQKAAEQGADALDKVQAIIAKIRSEV